MKELEKNRDAVITIQGGGVFGLTLLGQLQAVLEEHRYAPLALAGTSAGAIVATLVWAGLPPSEIREELKRLAVAEGGTLASLLGPFEPPDFDFDAFRSLGDEIKRGLKSFDDFSRRRIWNPRRWAALAGLFTRSSKMRKGLQIHFENRGFFCGDNLEATLDRLLRRASDVPGNVTSPGELLRFRHFAELMERHGEDSYRPPLLLTATNLTRQRLEVVSSVDPRYANVPVAKAVRASAGFPVFFSPRELPECPDGGWFVDGGVVSNFPVWAFSDAFRHQVQSSPIYRRIAARPWIRIGLRVVEDVEALPDLSAPDLFFRSLVSMLTGSARNQLEEILSSTAVRALIIKQPRGTTGGPGTLDLRALDARRIDAMVESGFRYADDFLSRHRSPGVYVKNPRPRIRRELETIVERALFVLGVGEGEAKLRANVLVPVEDRLKLLFSYRMDGDPDEKMEFPDLESGLAGFCYASRCPQVCNLREVAALRQKNPEEYRHLFGMSANLQGKVRPDRTWLAAVPLFDPFEVRFVRQGGAAAGAAHPAHPGKAYHGLEPELDGAVLGVLTMDAGWDYDALGIDPDPDVHYRDPKIQAIVSLMQSTAFSISRLLSEIFPGQGAP